MLTTHAELGGVTSLTGVLMSAVVTVVNPNDPDKSIRARALLDTCAERSFITDRLQKKLQLPVVNAHQTLNVRGFASTKATPLATSRVLLSLPTNDNGNVVIT